MASSNQTTKLKLSQFAATDKPQWLTDYNSDMEKIDEGTLDTATYDPSKVGGDAFLASNHKMTGYSKFAEYTPVLPSDSTLNAIAKLDAGFGTRGDMSKSVYDPTNVNGDAFWAANHKLTGYEKPEIAGEITADDDVRTALGKLDAGKIKGITPGKNITVDNTDPANPVISALSGAVWQDMEPAEGMTAAYAKFIRLTDSLALAVIDISISSGTFTNLQKLCSFPAGVNALPMTYQPCTYLQGSNLAQGLVFPGKVPSDGSFGIHTNYGFTDKNRVIATLILELLQGETT